MQCVTQEGQWQEHTHALETSLWGKLGAWWKEGKKEEWLKPEEQLASDKSNPMGLRTSLPPLLSSPSLVNWPT